MNQGRGRARYTLPSLPSFLESRLTFMVKKSGSWLLTRPLKQKMLPEFYLNCLNSQLSASQLLSLEMLVWLLQFHKQVRRLAPGMKLFFTGVKFTKKKGFGQFSLAAYWKRKYRGKGQDEGWYILTNLNSLDAALKVYKARSGIEAMFKDCKSGGYNLEGSKASVERLTNLVLLIAIAYTCAGLHGQVIKSKGQQKYIGRLKELKRMTRRHSNFWIGLYGQMWIAALESCSDWVRNLMIIRPNKRTFFQKGLRAMALIQSYF